MTRRGKNIQIGQESKVSKSVFDEFLESFLLSKWNSLPFEVKKSLGMNQYQNAYDKHLESAPFGVYY